MYIMNILINASELVNNKGNALTAQIMGMLLGANPNPKLLGINDLASILIKGTEKGVNFDIFTKEDEEVDIESLLKGEEVKQFTLGENNGLLLSLLKQVLGKEEKSRKEKSRKKEKSFMEKHRVIIADGYAFVDGNLKIFDDTVKVSPEVAFTTGGSFLGM